MGSDAPLSNGVQIPASRCHYKASLCQNSFSSHFSLSTQTPASQRCVAIEVTTSQLSITGS